MQKLRCAIPILLLSTFLVSCAPGESGNTFHQDVHRVMDKSRYRNAAWNLAMVDGDHLAESVRPDAYFIPGSTAKLFAAGAAMERLGAQSRTRTPVYATTKPAGGKVSGDLVLVASGDMNLGGRSAGRGPIEYSDSDHNEANVLPRATLTPGDPLSGLDSLAKQVRDSGTSEIQGEVVIDDRLFTPFSGWSDGIISPIMVNDNVIDIAITPTSDGSIASVSQRPFVSGYVVNSNITTGAPGSTQQLVVRRGPNGKIEATGTIPADADPQTRVFRVEDPAAFARNAFIDALRRAGVVLSAQPGAVNPNPPPASYEDSNRLAVLESATLADEAKVILKVSFNRGADLLVCRLAVSAGSRNCLDGVGQIEEVLRIAGVGETEAYLFDGAGSDDHTRTAPTAFVKWLEFARSRAWADALVDALPIMGVDGSLAEIERNSAAMGKVRAKTGTRATSAPTGSILLYAKSLVGYVVGKSGRTYVLVVAVNGVPVESIKDVEEVAEDLGEMASALQQAY